MVATWDVVAAPSRFTDMSVGRSAEMLDGADRLSKAKVEDVKNVCYYCSYSIIIAIIISSSSTGTASIIKSE